MKESILGSCMQQYVLLKLTIATILFYFILFYFIYLFTNSCISYFISWRNCKNSSWGSSKTATGGAAKTTYLSFTLIFLSKVLNVFVISLKFVSMYSIDSTEFFELIHLSHMFFIHLNIASIKSTVFINT